MRSVNASDRPLPVVGLLPMLGVLLVAWSGIGVASDLLSGPREWTNAEGKSITAAVQQIDGDRVVFLIRGKEVPYAIARLSPESRAELERLRGREADGAAAGQVSFLCIRANFSDRAIHPDDPDAWWREIEAVFAYAEPFFRLQSYGRITGMPIAITEVFAIDRSWLDYKGREASLAEDLRRRAAEAGWKPDDYDHVVLSFPSIDGAYGALGTPGTIWLPGEAPWPPGFAHEVGHAFGLGHAGTWEGGARSWPGVHDEGSDAFFTMGSGPVGTGWNLPMRFVAGWLDESHVRHVGPGTKTVRLHRLDVERPSLTGPVGVRARDFWISYAPGMPCWQEEGVPPEVVREGVFVHTLHSRITRLVDATPGSRANPDPNDHRLDSFHDAKDASVVVGSELVLDRHDLHPGYRLTVRPLRTGGPAGDRWIDVEIVLEDAAATDPLVAADDFDGPPGPLTDADGGAGWSAPWQRDSAAGDAGRIAAGLQRPGIRSRGGSLRLTAPPADDDTLVVSRTLGRTVGAEGSSLWVSFLFRIDTPGIGDMVLALGGNGELIVGKPWGAAAGVYLSHADRPLAPGRTHLLVARFDFAAPRTHARLWVDPPAEGPPDDATAAAAAAAVFVETNELSFRLQGHGHGSYTIDELRLGATYESVVPAP